MLFTSNISLIVTIVYYQTQMCSWCFPIMQIMNFSPLLILLQIIKLIIYLSVFTQSAMYPPMQILFVLLVLYFIFSHLCEFIANFIFQFAYQTQAVLCKSSEGLFFNVLVPVSQTFQSPFKMALTNSYHIVSIYFKYFLMDFFIDYFWHTILATLSIFKIMSVVFVKPCCMLQ